MSVLLRGRRAVDEPIIIRMKAIMDCVSCGHVFLLLSAGLVLRSSATGNRNEIMPRTAGLDSGFREGELELATLSFQGKLYPA